MGEERKWSPLFETVRATIRDMSIEEFDRRLKEVADHPFTQTLNMLMPPNHPSGSTQQEILRDAAKTLGLTQKGLAQRMGAPWPTFEKWLLPPEAVNTRRMPAIAWHLVQEILAHEALKEACLKVKRSEKSV